jgi:hypothetical protein
LDSFLKTGRSLFNQGDDGAPQPIAEKRRIAVRGVGPKSGPRPFEIPPNLFFRDGQIGPHQKDGRVSHGPDGRHSSQSFQARSADEIHQNRLRLIIGGVGRQNPAAPILAGESDKRCVAFIARRFLEVPTFIALNFPTDGMERPLHLGRPQTVVNMTDVKSK